MEDNPSVISNVRKCDMQACEWAFVVGWHLHLKMKIYIFKDLEYFNEKSNTDVVLRICDTLNGL